MNEEAAPTHGRDDRDQAPWVFHGDVVHGSRNSQKCEQDTSRPKNDRPRATIAEIVGVVFGVLTFVAACVVAAIYCAQLQAMRTELVLANRSWLVVKEVTIENETITQPEPVRTKTTIFNAGHSPGTAQVFTTCKVDSAHLSAAPEIPWPENGSATVATVTVGPSLETYAFGSNLIFGNIADIPSRESNLYCFGIIRYSDPIAKKGETRFCEMGMFNPETPNVLKMSTCPFHNDFE